MYDIKSNYIILSILVICSYSCWVINGIDYLDNSIKYEDAYDMSTEDEETLLRVKLIFPGTKWCGAGDIADNNEDLGTSIKTDTCCRDHDKCFDIIPAGETKHNLTNKSSYTRLHCSCDEAFRKCLLDAKSTSATLIGKFYFNTLGTKCFREDHPISGCSKRVGLLRTKCLKYTFHTNDERLYQWFDVENF